jgi:hypothetical protein
MQGTVQVQQCCLCFKKAKRTKQQMIQKKIMVFMITLIALMATSCQKSDETPVQPDKVLVSITSPGHEQQVRKGDTVLIKANISYVSRLHGCILRIQDSHTGEVYFTTEDHEHSDKFTVDEKWVDTLADERTLKLVITTEITHEGDTTRTERTFKSLP